MSGKRTQIIQRVMLPILLSLLPAVAAGVESRPAPEADPGIKTNPQCGHYAVLHTCRLLGVPVELSTLIEQLPPRKNGHSMLELLAVLQRLGLAAEGRAGDLDTLRGGAFPVIAHTNYNHFIVVERIEEGGVLLLDGLGRRQVWSVARFSKSWDGKMLRVSRPQPDRPLPDCPVDTAKAPRIQFDTLFIDHGVIPDEQKKVDYVFILRNTGPIDLNIEKVRTGCRCLQSTKPDRPIPPGGSGRIVLTYGVTEPRPFLQTAYVHSSDPCQPVIKLTVSGNTDRRVFADPSTIEMGRIAFSRSRTARCTIIGTTDVPLTVLKATCDLPDTQVQLFELTPQNLQKLQAGGARMLGNTMNAHLVCLTLTAQGLRPQTIKGNLEVTTSTKGFEHLVIPVHADIVAPLTLAPEVLYFGEVEEGDRLEQTVSVVACDQSLFRIRGVDPADAGIRCTFGSQPQVGRSDLQFAATGGAAVRLTGKTISVRVESETTPGEFVLPLKVYAKPKQVRGLH